MPGFKGRRNARWKDAALLKNMIRLSAPQSGLVHGDGGVNGCYEYVQVIQGGLCQIATPIGSFLEWYLAHANHVIFIYIC